MKRNGTISIAVIALVAAMAFPVGLAAQQYHHYELIDMGTYGGPQSYTGASWGFDPFHVVNNLGVLTGFADTSTLDPYGYPNGPNLCFDPAFNAAGTQLPCYTAQPFEWLAGFRIPLKGLSEGVSSSTNWISSNGIIAGASQNGETDQLLSAPGAPVPIVHAVLWNNGHIKDLGTLPEGGYQSAAHSVNSSGQAVGWALNNTYDANSLALNTTFYDNWLPYAPYQTRAFLWENGRMKDLGDLGGGDAFAFAINEAGQVIGIAYTTSTPNQVSSPNPGPAFWCSYIDAPMPTQEPFLWEKGKGMISLGNLGGTCGWPIWINSFGQVVGASDLYGDQVTHAFLWTKGKPMKDLQNGSTLDGSFGNATMINDLGVVVGGAFKTGTTEEHAFLWDGTMHDLGAFSGFGYAFSINASGQVVGNWGLAPPQNGGFLSENGGPIVDLKTLLSSNNSGLTLESALEINDLGEIVGIGLDAESYSHAILLVPCDANHTGMDGCDYSMVDASAITTAAPAVQAPTTGNPTNPMWPSRRGRRMP